MNSRALVVSIIACMGIAAGLVIVACCVTVPLALYGEFERVRECPNNYDEPNWTPTTRYPITHDMITATGVMVSTEGSKIAPSDIDVEFSRAEKCLGQSIYRCGLDVAIAGDEVVLAHGAESLPCSPGWVCPGVVQPPHTAVTTENLSSLVHELCHLVLRRQDHGDVRFSLGGCCN